MALGIELLKALADGQAHSGEALAARFGLSRTAIWKQLQPWVDRGVALQARRGVGYCIDGGLELLDAAAIRGQLPAPIDAQLAGLEVLAEAASTNTWLLERAARTDSHAQVVFAEYQSAGRGRRGREWRSPFGSGLLLSIAWRFDNGPAALAGLSLAVGVAVARAIARCGVAGVGLKWPNDLYAGNAKLGGILIELRGEDTAGMTAVIGIGLNVNEGPPAELDLRNPSTCLRAVAGARQSRNRLAAAVVQALLEALPVFAHEGFGAFRDDWLAADVALGRDVTIDTGTGPLPGRVSGVDGDGALLLQHEGGQQRILAGDVSLRL